MVEISGITGEPIFYGKVAKFPKGNKAKTAYSFLESIKIPKNLLWYFIIEKQVVGADGKPCEELQMIKYNNNQGLDLVKLVGELKVYYKKKFPEIVQYLEAIVIDGNDKFSIIKNIPTITINNIPLVSIITKDMIKLLK